MIHEEILGSLPGLRCGTKSVVKIRSIQSRCNMNEITSIDGDQWETLSKINYCNGYVEYSIEIWCIVRRESFSRDRLKSGRRKRAIEACLSIMQRACAIMTLTLEEKLGGMEILISIGVGSGASRFISLDLYLDRAMYRAIEGSYGSKC